MHNILKLGGAKKKSKSEQFKAQAHQLSLTGLYIQLLFKINTFSLLLYGILAAWKCKKALNSVQCWGMFIFR
jgi:hypothetical protein